MSEVVRQFERLIGMTIQGVCWLDGDDIGLTFHGVTVSVKSLAQIAPTASAELRGRHEETERRELARLKAKYEGPVSDDATVTVRDFAITHGSIIDAVSELLWKAALQDGRRVILRHSPEATQRVRRLLSNDTTKLLRIEAVEDANLPVNEWIAELSHE
jgi:hypothetical protein